MKKIIYILALALLGIAFNSCEDLLDKPPLDEISDPLFWKSDNDLRMFVNQFYDDFDGWSRTGAGWSWLPDNGTDVAIYTFKEDRLDGAGSVPSAATSQLWSWNKVRDVNYFLENAGRATTGDPEPYIGEGYFFRAKYYFELLEMYGDLPIVKKPVTAEDDDILYGTRSPRSEVADFIISDLDLAIAKLGTDKNRVHKDMAQLFKARVCLYEGTWEKYHQGTDFAGSTNGSAYLQMAADAAKAVMDGGRAELKTGDPDNVYGYLFNQNDLSGNKEILFHKTYDFETLGRNFGNDLSSWPNRSGITRQMIQSYLCADGLPYAVSPLYKGDNKLADICEGRDPRCVQSVMVPGDIIRIKAPGDTIFFTKPDLTDNNYCPTAYESQKFRNTGVGIDGLNPKNTVYILFRYAEALLIYAEAKAELGTLTQADVDMTINKLRDRVAMPHLVLGSITPDPNWPNYGYSIPDYLYEVRRERQVELFGEGFRFNDLMRWRAHNIFVGTRPKGARYTDFLKAINPNLKSDSEGYLDPYQSDLSGPNGGYGFNPNRDYLLPIPTNELTLNPGLGQNPGW